ncbi:hypothetical protein F5X68DRAFT_201404 [Plectosphaerella plurivora]|uniref:Uncharacterized protein n=1 Tax=Plectosphaerella plurivora TaxID=936078 RepID=A0A9P9AEE1_9PEZI|nr:hypothetical protein F5X68DRAFT_201404 [Plectosphaerella plurivora]
MKFQIFAATTLFAALAITSPLNLSPAGDNNLAVREEAPPLTDLELAADLALTEVPDIPDEVLIQGGEALDNWLIEHGLSDNDPSPTARGEEATSLSVYERDEIEARGVLQVATCVAAISKFILMHTAPPTKLKVIKRWITALGGVRPTVTLLSKAKTQEERFKLGGQVLVDLWKELSGYNVVKKGCASYF